LSPDHGPQRGGFGRAAARARTALASAVFFRLLREIRERAFENQRYSASGLNLVLSNSNFEL
jgi:TnpA family transposase